MIDINSLGTIEAKNLKVVLRALDFEPNPDEINKLLKEIGKGNKNYEESKIDFQEFLEIMVIKMVLLNILNIIQKN